ncbi:MAG: CoA transferase [Chloroflexi bacterium]|nr:CoA transferase [Chloroflexota bacterium]
MQQKSILSGVRVLSIEQVHVLPWGTAFLADLGAEVIRVESVEHMNDRAMGPFADGKAGEAWWNEGGTFAYWNRNKESLCLEVAHPLGKEAFLKLVKRCDVVCDNFRPGTMRRLGLDHESLARVNPAIITLSCTAYGHTGPWRAAGARARTVDAASGLTYLTGYEGGPSIRASSNYMDHNSGNNVAFALLLALYNKQKTGKGLRIDLSMQETGVQSIAPAILEAQDGYIRPRLGTAHLWKAPHGVFPCQGQDRWIAITVSSDQEWQRLRKAMGEPAWSMDARYGTVTGRWNHRHDLDKLLSEWTAPQDSKALMHHLQRCGVTAAAVYTAADLVADPHLNERSYFEAFDNKNAPAAGPRKLAGRPFRMSNYQISLRQVPALGEHNRKLLQELAGLTDGEIESLVEQGVLHTTPKPDEPRPQGGGGWGGGG